MIDLNQVVVIRAWGVLAWRALRLRRSSRYFRAAPSPRLEQALTEEPGRD